MNFFLTCCTVSLYEKWAVSEYFFIVEFILLHHRPFSIWLIIFSFSNLNRMKRAGSAPSLTPTRLQDPCTGIAVFLFLPKNECQLCPSFWFLSSSKQNFYVTYLSRFLQIVYFTIPYEDTPLPPVQFALTVI